MKDKTTIMADSVKVGWRIESAGSYGTVRYKGAIPPTKGVWLGIEWDDSSRGKHDGSHEGKRYFQTQNPTAGSFVRVEKINLGLTVLATVQDRYGLIEDESAGVIEEDLYLTGTNKKVEVVGAQSVNKQQSQFDKLKELGLREMYVRCAGLPGEVSAMLPKVEILDISKNLMHDWALVADIAREFSQLNTLNVSENRLTVPDNGVQLAENFQKLKILFLNRMEYDWQQILQCVTLWPNLSVLHACFNDITVLSNPVNKLQKLTTLNFESNPISDWEQLLHVGQLPRLETLIVNDTGIEKIWFPDCGLHEKTQLFKHLKQLSIYKNKISEWSSINELNKLQSLQDLRCKKNPIMTVTEKTTEETLRYIVMAKIANLKICNRTEVTSEERQSCELDYMKLFGKSWRDCGGHQDSARNKPTAEFTYEHPRYQYFIDKYGAPSDRELIPQSSALKHTLITINIDSPMIPEKPKITKKLPVSMTVQKLKMILRILYKVDPMSMKLTYTSRKMADQEIDIETDQKELGYYSIEDGDIVHVRW